MYKLINNSEIATIPEFHEYANSISWPSWISMSWGRLGKKQMLSRSIRGKCFAKVERRASSCSSIFCTFRRIIDVYVCKKTKGQVLES